jgi:hypothetical protein
MADTQVRAFREIAAVPAAAVGERVAGFEHVQAFLQRFGYLTPGAVTAGALDAATSAALAKYQQFNALPVTGQFDAATRDAMTRPRCALPDSVRGMKFATTCRWNRADLTYALDTGTNDVAGQAEWDAIRAAFRTWQALQVLTFREVGLTQNPDIRVGWRPANDPDLSMVGGTLAHADFPPACSIVTNTLPKPVHFDDTEHTWAVGAVLNAFDIETVALHEIGHIVGLAHSSVPGAVMQAAVAANFARRVLTQDDIDGFNALYAKVPDVRELRQALAASQVRAARLVPRFTGMNGPQAWVWQQSPRADAIVAPQSTVTLQLRTGPIP